MPQKHYRRLIVWFRRDLRLYDNEALNSAVRDADEVIPVFILDDAILHRQDIGASRVAFLVDALHVLDSNLRKLSGRLIVRLGKNPETLVKFAQEVEADGVYFHEEYEPAGRERDNHVTEALTRLGKKVQSFPGLALIGPSAIVSKAGTPYTVFTPFKNAWLETPVEASKSVPASITVPSGVHGDSLPAAGDLSSATGQRFECGGEDAALKLLESFTEEKLTDYGTKRNDLGEAGTSLLSRHLHFGTISPRTVVEHVRGRSGGDPFITEIAWRDFYLHILHHFPYVEKGAFKRNLGSVSWQDDDRLFQCWCDGMTGYPIVDAAMRQMNQEAWMHNRARMIVASFLCKDLLINWQRGERYFMKKLVDGDLASNNGGWQWAAGTGTDAQPYFRVFNPITQGEKFDSLGKYVRKYVPELSKVPDKFIHSPWKLSVLEQEACGCVLGTDYPTPVVDHASQRLLAIKLYKEAADSADNGEFRDRS